MGKWTPLRVRVNSHLTLDAGAVRAMRGRGGGRRVIRPPATTLFGQVFRFLMSQPDPTRRLTGTVAGREGVAAAAVTLRWGSYLAVLLDPGKPVWSKAGEDEVSAISDSEMARINIEASAGLANWLDFFRLHRGQGPYLKLVDRAVAYLPMPRKTSRVEVTPFYALSDCEHARQFVQLMERASPSKVIEARGMASKHPTRLMANALLNSAWRNGPVEDVHAGGGEDYPLHRRRVTVKQERLLLGHVAEGFAAGMAACLKLSNEHQVRSWSDQVLPYGMAELLGITPGGWTYTESSCEVHLPPQRGSARAEPEG